MACLGSCSICGTGTMDSSTCGECEKETTSRVLANLPTDKESIKKAVEEKRSAQRDKAMEEMLTQHQEDMGRNYWRKYMNERDDAYKVIDEAIEKIDAYGNNSEMQFLRKLLDAIPTGRKSKKKWAKAKKLLRDNFAKNSTFFNLNNGSKE